MDIRTLTVVFQLFVVVLVCDAKKPKTSGCPKGCDSCSPFNGCLVCKPRYFLLLNRIGMMHKGTCTRTCPGGYYSSHSNHIDKCYKCRVDNCDICFNKSYCSRCLSTHFLYLGKCVAVCPTDYYQDKKSGECRRVVDCEVTDWSLWGPCGKNGKYCGYKWGLQTRTRDIIVKPTPNGSACPIISERRQCRLKRRRCSDTFPNAVDDKDNNKRKDGKKKKGKKSKKNRRRNKRKDTRRTKSKDRYLNPTLKYQPTFERLEGWDMR
ncbi:R-spondin-3-like [Anneissia japonica]|uniref:R-spondin-3-like n=1 Tax=Anneissia japonica TaxID=1529436 RepID=UPI0014258630|nr:R-spondin-3-like [Anneissia japonica]